MDGSITIYPAKAIKLGYAENEYDPNFRTKLIGSILHELSHVADPKMDKSKDLWFSKEETISNINENLRKNNIGPYLSFPPEIDAIMQQVIYDIEIYFRSGEKNATEVKKWLEKPLNVAFEPIKSIIGSNNVNVIEYWIDHNPKIIRMLKQRIYNVI
jgi:hypothetical protein